MADQQAHPGTQHSGDIGDGEDVLCLGCGVFVWVYKTDEHIARCPWKPGDPTWMWDEKVWNTMALQISNGTVLQRRRPPLEEAPRG